MKGAEYATLFETGQYGNIYITSGSHARGKTLRIQVLPDGEKAIPNGSQNACLNETAVEVYGVISGNPGWTEVYGWIHQGKWCDDFQKLVDTRNQELEQIRRDHEEWKTKDEAQRKQKELELLNSYK